jgi:hypothetical protein
MPMSPRTLRPRKGGFNPLSIPGLALWLDAADTSTITVGTGVSQWRDKSATGSLWTQGTGNNQPATGTQAINGRNVLVFDGVNDTLTASNPVPTAMPATAFFVFRLLSKSNFGMLWAGSDTVTYFSQQSTSGVMQWVFTSTWAATAAEVTGNATIATAVWPTAGNGTARFNGADRASTTARPSPSGLTGTHYLGSFSSGNWGNFALGEVLWYSRDLTATERAAVETGLASKWGVTLP